MNGREALELQWEQWRLEAEECRWELELQEKYLYGWDRPSNDDDETLTEEVTMNDERDTEISE